MKHVLFDTSTLMRDPKIISQVISDKVVVVICTTVIEELDYNKEQQFDKGFQAREVSREIDRCLREGKNLIVLHEMKTETPLNLRINDNKIIAHALYLREIGKNVVLFSNDTNLRIKANAFADEFGIFIISEVNQLADIPDVLDVATPSLDNKKAPINQAMSFLQRAPMESLDQYKERLENSSISVGTLISYSKYDNTFVFQCKWNNSLPIIYPSTNTLILKGLNDGLTRNLNEYPVQASFQVRDNSICINLERIRIVVDNEEILLVSLDFNKMDYESIDDYKTRIIDIGPVPLSRAELLDSKYNSEKGSLPIKLQTDNLPLTKGLFALFGITPDQARHLIAESTNYVVYVEFNFHPKEEAQRVMMLFVKGNRSMKYYISSVQANLTPILLDEQQWLIDRNNLLRKDLSFEQIESFTESIYLVTKVGRKGLLSNEGYFMLQPIYDQIFALTHEHIRIQKGNRFGLCEYHGNIVLDPIYVQVDLLGNYYRLNNNGSVQLINKKLQKVGTLLDTKKEIWAIHEQDKWNLLNHQGKWMSEIWFDELGNNAQNKILINLANKWGLLSLELNNRFIVNPIYDSLQWFDFEKGILKGEKESKIYILQANGETIGESIKQVTPAYENVLFKLKSQDKVVIVNESCELVVNIPFDDIGFVVNRFIAVKLDGFWGVITNDGTWIVVPNYLDIKLVNPDVCIGHRENTKDILTIEADEIHISQVTTIEEIEVEQTEKGLLVNFDPNLEGVHLFYSFDIPHPVGAVLDIKEFMKENYRQARNISPGEALIDIDQTGSVYLLVVIKIGSVGIVINSQKAIYVKPLDEIKGFIENEKMYINWTWPNNTTYISINYGLKEYPVEPTRNIQKVRKPREQKGQLKLPYENGNEYYISLFGAFHTEGETYFSKPAFLHIRKHEIKTIHYSINLKRNFFGRIKEAELILNIEGTVEEIPDLVLVKKHGYPPINREDGKSILFINNLTFLANPKHRILIPEEYVEKNAYVQLFYANATFDSDVKLVPQNIEQVRLW